MATVTYAENAYDEDELRSVREAVQRELNLKDKSAKELGELLGQPRDEILRLQRVTQDEVRDFTAEEQAAWLRLNVELDAITRARDSRSHIESVLAKCTARAADEPRPGRDDVASRNGTSVAIARAGDGHSLPDPRARKGKRDADPVTREVRALALQGWLLYDAGKPLRRGHVEALQKLRIRPSGREFRIALDMRSPELRALTVTTTAGGYAIPQGFRDVLERAMLQYGQVRQVATVMRTPTGADLPMPTVNDTSNKGALLAINTQVANQDVAFGQVVLNAYKMSSKQVLVPVELIQDSAFNLDELLGSILGERIARIENDYYTTGTGTSQPQGIVTGATLGVTAASATAIAADELFALIHALDPAYRAQASGFMMHDNVLLAVRKMKDGNGRYLWEPDLTAATPGRLLGYPITVNQSMASSIATGNKTVLFGNFKKFMIRDVAELRLRRLEERYADFDQVGFLAFHRTDSKLLDAGTHPVVYLQQA